MSDFWSELELMVKASALDVVRAKVAARETGHSKVKLVETGIWSAKRSWTESKERVDARSCDGLIEAMRAGGKPRPGKPQAIDGEAPGDLAERTEKWAKREAAFRAGVEGLRCRLLNVANQTREERDKINAEKKKATAERRRMKRRA